MRTLHPARPDRPRPTALGTLRVATVVAVVCAFALPAQADEPPPHRGLLTARLAYLHLSDAASPVPQAQDAFLGQLGYARRSLPDGLYWGVGLDFAAARSGAGMRKTLGPAVRGGWDIGAQQNVVLDAGVAPVYAWSQAPDPGSTTQAGPGVVADASVAVPWFHRAAMAYAQEGDPVRMLAALLVLVPNTLGVRVEHVPGDGQARFGVLVGWSFAAPLWE